MTQKISRTLLVAAALAAAAQAVQAAPPQAKISPKTAMANAVKKIPGKATAAKYEFEDGYWQYAVTVIDKTGQRYEAEVSSTTGEVTATEKTSAAEEAREAAADKKAALKPKKTSKSQVK